MVKFDAAVFHFINGVFRIMQVAFFVQNFFRSFHRRVRNGNHNEYHGEHHQTHKDLHCVREHTGQVPCGHAHSGVVTGSHNEFCTQPGDQQHTSICAELHQRRVERQNFFCFGEVLINFFGNGTEFFCFMVFTDKRFDYTNAVEVFLYHIVQFIVCAEYPFKNPFRIGNDDYQTNCQNRDSNDEYGCQMGIDLESHKQRKNQHDRTTHRHTDGHHIRVLDVGNIRCQTRYDTCGGELINVGERIFLYFVVHIFPQVFCKARRSHCRIFPRQCPKGKGNNTADDQCQPHFQDVLHVTCLNPKVDEVCHQHGNDHFQNDLTGHEQRRQ